MKARWILLIVILMTAATTVVLWGGVAFLRSRRAEVLNRLEIGSSADKIIGRMGMPGHIIQPGEPLAHHAPHAPQGGPVFIYDRGAVGIFFVYFDSSRRVVAARWRAN